MSDRTLPLFNPSEVSTIPSPAKEPGKPRIEEPMRLQSEIRFKTPDESVPGSHLARVLWNIVGTLNLAGFSKGCESVDGKSGRSLKSPRMLLTLWLYAISQAVGSAREIARLTMS